MKNQTTDVISFVEENKLSNRKFVFLLNFERWALKLGALKIKLRNDCALKNYGQKLLKASSALNLGAH